MSRPSLVAVAASALLAAVSSQATATPASPPADTRAELVGLEIDALSLSLAGPVDSHVKAGIGGMVRFGKLTWTHAYWTPIELGIFLGGSGFKDVMLGRVLTEGGLRIKGGFGTFELGLGAGPGLLAIATPGQCDGTCRLGGAGLVLSPVLRYLVANLAPVPLGLIARGEVPTSTREDLRYGYSRGYGAAVLFGVEVGSGQWRPW